MNLRAYLPGPVKAVLKKIRRIVQKPELRYVEFHLTDHCNMNCAGCGHFSSLASPWFADPAQHETDMRRLAQLFSNIHTIKVMGGEPLLHPKVVTFLDTTRRYFPKADIHLITNGILIPQMGEDFWAACQKNKIRFDITIYPPMLPRREKIEGLVTARSIPATLSEVSEFWCNLNPRGDSDPCLAMQKCRARFYCPFLGQGKIYVCALPAMSHYYNQAFGARLPPGEGIDLYAPGLTGWDVIERLNRPVAHCACCGYDFRKTRWAVTRKKSEEWEIQ